MPDLLVTVAVVESPAPVSVGYPLAQAGTRLSFSVCMAVLRRCPLFKLQLYSLMAAAPY